VVAWTSASGTECMQEGEQRSKLILKEAEPYWRKE
jgi:hypothetical protein